MIDRPSQRTSRWLPVWAAAGLLAIVVGVGVSGGDAPNAAITQPISPTTISTAPTTPVTTHVADPPVDSVPKVPLSSPVSRGSVGGDVERVQTRLAELAFYPGPADSSFGALTQQAVWAFEKLVMGVPREEATGVVTAAVWSRMQDPIVIAPRTPSGGLANHVEIYLPEQVMVVFHADRPVVVTHVSTGELRDGATGFTLDDAFEYCETVRIDTDIDGNLLPEPEEKPICGQAYTPPGVFAAHRTIEGRRDGPLGGMYDPIYINQGIAIHGANEIPLHPASHGCIRVSRQLGEELQSMIELGDRVLIWDGKLEPHQQSAEAMKMRWDYPDPSATTTTSTTSTTSTTTTTTTTTVPTTTMPATTLSTTTLPPITPPTTTIATATTMVLGGTTVPPPSN
ncbi:MAG TPA: L,D-transpeptidase family protein [Ilumatobacter sp.]|nr:L,D-transpeptidase family protein [Ilumatobacter sp.]